MARRRAKSTPDTEGIQSQTTVKANDPAQDNVSSRILSQGTVNDASVDDIMARIEKLAYELYQRGGCRDGHDREDWLEAERLALGEQTAASNNGTGSLTSPSPSLM